MRSDNVEMKRQGQAAGVYSLRGFLLRHCGPVGYTQHFLGQSCRNYVKNALVLTLEWQKNQMSNAYLNEGHGKMKTDPRNMNSTQLKKSGRITE